jgi:serine protease Do
MTNDPRPSFDRDPTEPVEVQRYGPPTSRDPGPSTWRAANAWSSRPPQAKTVVTAPRRSLSALPIIAIAVVAGIVSGALSAVAIANLMDEPAVPAGSTAESPTANNVSDVRLDESSAVIDAATKVTPAVVTIQTTTGGFLSPGAGTGSGVIYDGDGWILTNRHVVENAEGMIVLLDDGRQFSGEVYGIDTMTDLAIVKIDASGLPTAPIGTSADLEPGQLAIAIGNPSNYTNTVTTGVVSGLGRRIEAQDPTSQTGAETLQNLIQTDAAINPGNSGGPLINSAGQVIGVNTAVSTSAQGLGFAIPIDVAKPIMQQALDGRELVRPWIGVVYTPVTPGLAAEQDLPVEYGALLTEGRAGPGVVPGSPADAAGLRLGDIIVEIDGQQITSDTDLATEIVPHEPGDTITLRILRDNTTSEVEVTLGELAADQ